VNLAARFQLVRQAKFDSGRGAQSPRGAFNGANLASLPPCARTYAVFSMLKDKDIAGVVAMLDSHIDTWLIAGMGGPRGTTTGELALILEQCAVRGKIQNLRKHHCGSALCL